MYLLSTREVSLISTAQCSIYNSVKIAYVSEFKYLGTWIDNRGSCDVQARELIKKATSSVYICMSKVRRLVFRRVPSSSSC